MKIHYLISILVLIFLSIAVSAQSLDDEGQPNDPHDNERANACYEGGSMEGKCTGIWEWNCGWYLIRFEAGILSRQDFPTQCSILLPPLPESEVVVVIGPPHMSVGCYKSSSGDFDFNYSGPINQANNIDVRTTNDGSCGGSSAGYAHGMIAYFEGSQADALVFCQSIDPAITYIENSLSRGYPVPNAYFWGCA